MKTSSAWNFRSVVSKIMMVLVLAVMIGSIAVASALAKDDHKDKGRHDNGRKEMRGRGYDRDRYDRRHYRPYGYGYAPPVICAPPQPPGIGIFFPPIIIRQ